jgi:hypothetical protein
VLLLGTSGLVSAAAYSVGQQTLLRVDPRTLAPLPGPTVRLATSSGLRLRSPDHTLLALADAKDPVVTFVDTDRMEVLATVRIGEAGTADLAAWPAERRLLGFAWGCCPVRTDLIVLDPVTKQVVARRPAAGSAWPRVALPGGLVYLASPAKAIKPARVVVVDQDGDSRSVVLTRIRSGTKWRRVHGVRVADIRQPGLAADPTGRTAYVVAASGLVAEVDLATLGVTYHSVAPSGTRRLARAQKSLNGPMRYARWIARDRIAVSGTDAKMTVTRAGATRQTWSSIGVSLIDTETWRSRLLDPQAGGFVRARSALLVPGTQSFTAYDLAGEPRFTIPLDEPLSYVNVAGDYAYAWGRERTTTIVDLASGAIVTRLQKPDFWLLTDEA